MSDPVVVVVAPQTPRVAIVQRGPRGLNGVAVSHEHVQSAPAAEWIVNHNLGAEPIVAVLTPGGVEMEASVVHVSVNQLRIYFASPQSGRARCL